MLTANKVRLLLRHTEVMMYIFREQIKIDLQAFEHQMEAWMSDYVRHENRYSVVQRCNKNGWFFTAIHGLTSDATIDRKCNASTKKSVENEVICSLISGDNNTLSVDYKLEPITGIGSVEDLESMLFQMQTVQSDEFSLMLLLEYYTRGRIGFDMHIPFNITKCLDISEELLESMVDFWEQFVEVYEETK